MLSIDISGESSHIIQHSLPKTPVDYYRRTHGIIRVKNQDTTDYTKWDELKFQIIPPEAERIQEQPANNNNNNDPTVQQPQEPAPDYENDVDETSTKVINDLTKKIWRMSQHVFCYSFGAYTVLFTIS